MCETDKFSEWDVLRLEIALEPLEKVRDFYYGSSKHRNSVNRLTTIIKKLQEVIDKNKEVK